MFLEKPRPKQGNQLSANQPQLTTPPTLSDEAIDKLPRFLKKAVEPFSDKHKRDAMLTGLITALSACFPSLSGLYAGKEVSASLTGLLIGDSGRMLQLIGQLLFPWNSKQKERDFLKVQQYEQDQIQYERYLRKPEDFDQPVTKPQFPELSAPLLPTEGDTSKIMLSYLNVGGKGLVIGEAPTHWPSMIWRLIKKSFNGQSETIITKGDGMPKTIKKARISTLIGTSVSRFKGLLAEVREDFATRQLGKQTSVQEDFKLADPGILEMVKEDFLTRLLPYYLGDDSGYVDPFEDSDNLDEYYNTLGQELASALDNFEGSIIKVSLSDDEKQSFHEHFQSKMQIMTTFLQDKDGGKVNERLALMIFRILMVLTAIRALEEDSYDGPLNVVEEDFKLALELSDTYLHQMLNSSAVQ